MARIAASETDIPAGVLNVVTSSDHAVGAQLSTDPRVDLVSFTGSTATGKKVMAAASDTLKRVFLELGGKSAAIILDDADLATAIPGLLPNSIMNNGQACIAQTRILASRARYDDVVDELIPRRSHFHHFGGSHAQRDLLQRTLTESAIRSGRLDLARALLDERLSVREASVYGLLGRARVLAERDGESGARRARDGAEANRTRFAAAWIA